ncbi:TadE/TadG family type IV pilus assembly protein [Bacterioplanoides sp.]|uniref:TadE/TadG family type IV pilus assembly protein n=1 Tax=Bacterioplanoides sp. TaxID=2066072 RepID=UPI003B5A259A
MWFSSIYRQTGQASIITVLVLPMLATLTLGAVDAGQWLLQRQKLTEFSRVAAMNVAGRIALSKEKNNAQLIAEANEIASELSLAYFGDNKTTVVPTNPEQQVVISALRDVDSMFLGAFIESFRTVEVRYQARADYAYEPGALDLTFVVDVSSSMGSSLASGNSGTKFARLQQTLLDLIDDLPDSAALAMVPFHEMGGVNINGALWLPESYSQPLCVDGRGGNNTDQVLAQLFNAPDNIQVVTEPQRGGDFLAENCPSQKVIPLTTDHIYLQQQIRQMPDANGSSTASLQGFIWGVRTLLESWGGRWNLEDLPRANNKSDKIMVVLSDGADSGSSAFAMRDLVAAGMCDRVREQGIDLWFIGFEVGGLFGSGPSNQLRNCYGDQLLAADNASELDAAIKKIIASSAKAKLRLVDEEA